MERFSLPNDISKRKKLVRTGIVYLALGILLLLVNFWEWETQQYKENPFIYSFLFVISFYACWSGIDRMQFRKEERFFEITANGLRWNFSEKRAKDQYIRWEDMVCIKLEMNQDLLFFRSASYHVRATTAFFSAAERYRIIVMVMEEAEKRNIRLDNFEQMAWALS